MLILAHSQTASGHEDVRAAAAMLASSISTAAVLAFLERHSVTPLRVADAGGFASTLNRHRVGDFEPKGKPEDRPTCQHLNDR